MRLFSPIPPKRGGQGKKRGILVKQFLLKICQRYVFDGSGRQKQEGNILRFCKGKRLFSCHSDCEESFSKKTYIPDQPRLMNCPENCNKEATGF
jgi:hypothetical protein